MKRSNNVKNLTVICLAGIIAFTMMACSKNQESKSQVIIIEENEEKVVNFFSPMEKSNPNLENLARSASERTLIMAEEKLGLKVAYKTYTAENYQDKTYDEVALDRARNNMDDMYLLNPDVIQILGEEDKLMDLSDLENVKNLREVVKTANVINGKLVAIPL